MIETFFGAGDSRSAPEMIETRRSCRFATDCPREIRGCKLGITFSSPTTSASDLALFSCRLSQQIDEEQTKTGISTELRLYERSGERETMTDRYVTVIPSSLGLTVSPVIRSPVRQKP